MATATASHNGNGASAAMPAVTTAPPITLQRLAQHYVEVPIIGATPLIMNRWSEKARRQMLDKQQGKATPKKAPKNPVEDYEAATYRLEDGALGFPATAFKAAIVDAARFFGKSVPGTMLRTSVRVIGEGSEQLVRIDGEPRMREDTVRLGDMNRTADLRYRPEVWPWAAVLHIKFVSSMLTHEALIALVDAAGNQCGVGEWRPSSIKSKTGTYGCFSVPEDV